MKPSVLATLAVDLETIDVSHFGTIGVSDTGCEIEANMGANIFRIWR